jgi:hypothetical protein
VFGSDVPPPVHEFPVDDFEHGTANVGTHGFLSSS